MLNFQHASGKIPLINDFYPHERVPLEIIIIPEPMAKHSAFSEAKLRNALHGKRAMREGLMGDE